MKVCRHCGAQIPGAGRQAHLCVDCWAEVIARVEAGEVGRRVAEEFGVSYNALNQKMFVYGGRGDK